MIRVESALEMRKAVMRELKKADCLLMAAAVSDWRISRPLSKKIKRAKDGLRLNLVENPDILAEAGKKKSGMILVGFVLETEDLARRAIRKLREKNLDIIIANMLTEKKAVFGDSSAPLLIIDRHGNRETLTDRTKREAAKIILDRVLNFKI